MNTRYNHLRPYRVTVKHDAGRTTITVTAQNKHAAAEKVVRCEGCPKSAILAVTPVKAGA